MNVYYIVLYNKVYVFQSYMFCNIQYDSVLIVYYTRLLLIPFVYYCGYHTNKGLIICECKKVSAGNITMLLALSRYYMCDIMYVLLDFLDIIKLNVGGTSQL